jgi:cytochrome c553
MIPSPLRLAAAAALFCATAAGAAGPAPQLPSAQSDYLLGCGGCHGLHGWTHSKIVPDLRNQAGYFLNMPEGRAYLIQLPNVAFMPLSDQALAEMMNFVVFTLGGDSAPPGAKPFDAREVSALRQHPLTEDGLAAHRAKLVNQLIGRYGASEKLRLYQAGPAPQETE